MAIDSNVLQEVVDALKQDPEIKNNVYQATVSRIDGEGVVWVNIAGSDTETPTAITSAEVAPGDSVNVEWRNNKLYIGGNYSNPSAGVVRVANVEQIADVAVANASRAQTAAANAEAYAQDAKETADAVHDIAVQASEDAGIAKTAAESAQGSADSALVGLSTVQDVVGVLNWITAHGTMTSQSGGTFDPDQVYFVMDDSTPGDYHVGSHYYSIVSEPKAADINSYYVLTVDESVQNYVATHIVVDSEGLWIIPNADGNKVLIATGSGSTYTTAGTYIVGKVNGVDAVFAKFTADGATMQRGSANIAHLGYGPGTSSGGGTADAPYYTLGLRSKATNVYDSTLRYYVGNLVLYGNPQKEYCCKVDIETPEAWTPSHWQLSIGNYSTEEGWGNVACGYSSHAEGSATKAFGYEAHSEGSQTIALGDYSHSECYLTTANGWASHAEGVDTTASGDEAHAEGFTTTASGTSSHAEGENTIASGWSSHAQNLRTIAGYNNQTAIGMYNDNQSVNAFEIGNGTDINRSNALTVDWSGNVEAAGDVTDGSGNTLSAVAVNDIISLKPSGNITRSGTGDSRVTSYTTITSNGSKLTNNGGVKIGSGVSLVKVCYGLAINTTGTNHTLNAQLYKNSTQQSAYGFDTKQAQSGRGAISFPPTLMSVSSGDVLDIGWYGQTGDTLYANGTTLTVEVVK